MSSELSLKCTGCGQTFTVGIDAIIMTTDMAIQTMRSQGVVVMGDLGQEAPEDMVDTAAGISPDRLPQVLAMARHAAEYVNDSLRKGIKRRWVCRSCRTVNDYPNA